MSRPTLCLAPPTEEAQRILLEFEESMRGWNASEQTILERVRIARRFLDAHHDLGAVRPVDVSRWLAEPSFSAWTRVTYFGHLKSFFAWALETGLTSENPLAKIRTPKSPVDRPRPLSAAEVETLLSDANGNQRAWLLLALYARLRAHEIAKIRGQDVREDAIFVVGKGRKEAFVPTHPILWELAQTMPERGWWFPSRGKSGHVSANAVTQRISEHFRRHGIEGSTHRGRHTFATQLLRSGANVRVVQELMRHGSLATTAKYTAVDEGERQEAVRLLG